MTTSPADRPAGRLGIGEVLRRLRPDFPDVSISKIRFLESEGLVEPQRTPSGYRKFSYADLEQLRYVLTAQRDHYLPLRVIRTHLDAMARGLEPPAIAGGAPRAPRVEAESGSDGSAAAPDVRLSPAELLANSGLTGAQLTQLHEYGLIRRAEGESHYDGAALRIATAVAALAAHGLEPRHLRVFRTAAEREVSLIDQVVGPSVRARSEEATARAAERRAELAALAVQLHAALVRQALTTSS